MLVPPEDVDALAEAIAYTDFHRFSGTRLRENAERFSTEEFRRRFTAEVRRALGLSVEPELVPTR